MNPDARVPQGGRTKVFLLSIVLMVVLAIGAGVCITVSRQQAERERIRARIAQALESLRASGEPLTFGDLARKYPDPPPDRDAAALLAPAFEQLCIPDDLEDALGEWEFKPAGAPLDLEVRFAIGYLLRTNHSALLLAGAADLRGTWVPPHFAQGLTNKSSSSLRPLTRLARLLCLQAMVEAEHQQGPGAVNPLMQAFQMGRACRNPIPIHQMCSWAIYSSGCKSLERVLNSTALSEADLARLANATRDEDEDALRRLLTGERVFGLALISQCESTAAQIVQTGRTPITRVMKSRLAAQVFVESDKLTYLEWQEQLAAVATVPPKVQFEWATTNEASIRQSRKDDSIALQSLRPSYANSFKGAATALANLRLSRTALALERWRIAHQGNLPDSLEQLVPTFLPSTPMDPFDEQPLRYKKLSRGYQLYCVGPDCIDDGGKPADAITAEAVRSDLTFTVAR